MNRGHHGFLNTKIIFKHAHNWGNAVGGTGGVRDNAIRIFHDLFIHAEYDSFSAFTFGWSGNYDSLRTSVKMSASLCWVSEETSRFNHHINAKLPPRKFSWISFRKHSNFSFIDDNIFVIKLHHTIIGAVR